MIKISDPDLSGFTLEDYKDMFGRIDGVLQKRSALHQLYIRTSSDSSILEGGLEVPFEKFIVDLATGYLSGLKVKAGIKDDDTGRKNIRIGQPLVYGRRHRGRPSRDKGLAQRE